MKILVDGNVILDVLQKRIPHYDESALVWKLCETGKLRGYVSSLTFANLVYVMRKELSPVSINTVLKQLSLILTFESLDTDDLFCAAGLQWEDFEDAIQSVTAKRIHADYIISRNIRDFVKSEVPVLSPGDLLESVGLT
ncbi:MAG: PIN domain-containing protein [Lachnospiraceae bacterium]|nr:PIN domain-containing protein [Lachnospiraceae bacterium]